MSLLMNYNFNGVVHEESVGAERRSCPSSWAPRPCDGCGGAPSSVYCRADSAYLCASCDARVHDANRVASRHERVRLFQEAFERCAPAAGLQCRADDAVAPYQTQMRYANQLISGMHQRLPVMSLPVDAAIPPAASVMAEAAAAAAATTTTDVLGDKKDEVGSWMLLSKDPDDNHSCSGMNNNNNCSSYFGEVDVYFDLLGYNSYYDRRRIKNNQEQYGMEEPKQQLQQMQMELAEKEGSECVVPSQAIMVSEPQQRCYGGVAAEQLASMTSGVSTYADSMSNSIFFSSMEVGIVPDSTVLDMPYSSILIPEGVINLFSGPSRQMLHNFSSTDREARVLRYKEKKKTTRFEKTTRYATRKAYAEARPRIKGRFAKRSDADIEVDQMFSTAALSDGSYSTVPWF